MTEDEALLIDAPLTPDPDADDEMGPGDVEAIADEDLRGCRLLLVRRAVEPIDLDGNPGGVLQMACTLQASQGIRFTYAQFRLSLLTPAGVKIIDIAPRVMEEPHPVEFTLDGKGKLGVKNLPVPVEPSVEFGMSKKFAVYHCQVQGSGEGTNMARWDFRENPDRRSGLGQEQILTLTLPLTGQVAGTVSVNARLARSGVRGSLEAIRDMILGPKPNDRFYPISFEIPKSPSPRGLARFLNLI